jgi:hypothetical protein
MIISRLLMTLGGDVVMPNHSDVAGERMDIAFGVSLFSCLLTESVGHDRESWSSLFLTPTLRIALIPLIQGVPASTQNTVKGDEQRAGGDVYGGITSFKRVSEMKTLRF